MPMASPAPEELLKLAAFLETLSIALRFTSPRRIQRMTASGDNLSATCAVYGEGMFDCCWDEDRDWRDRRAVE